MLRAIDTAYMKSDHLYLVNARAYKGEKMGALKQKYNDHLLKKKEKH